MMTDTMEMPKSSVTADDAVIRAAGLDLTFQTGDGPVHALQDVNLDVAKGDFVSFIGPSGCGKTTFLRCIAGLETPDRRHADRQRHDPGRGPPAPRLWLRLPGRGALPLAHHRAAT